VGILMNKELDREMKIQEGSNWIALITSTLCAAVGKYFGTFVEITSIRYTLAILFFTNGLMMYASLSTSDIWIFMIARNMEGFISGLQQSIIIGFISLLKDNKKGFAGFTGISAMVSLGTGLLLELLTGRNIGIILFVVNMIVALVAFYSLKDFNQTYKTVKVVKSALWAAILDVRFVFYAVFLGILLALSLTIVSQQVTLLGILLPNVHKFFITSLTFVSASIISMVPIFQNTLLGLICIVIGVISFNVGIINNIHILTIIGCMTAFSCFAMINPVICHNVTRINKDKFVVSVFFFSIRSAFTAFGLFITKIFNLPVISLISYSLGAIAILTIMLTLMDKYMSHESSELLE